MKRPWQFWIDTGGTFTDCIAISPGGKTHFCKVLSDASLRGTVEQVVSAREFSISHSWTYTPPVFAGFQFKANDRGSIIEAFDPRSNIIKLRFDLHLEKGSDFSIHSGEEAPVLAIRLITGTALDQHFPDLELKLGTTKGTNALLEGKGAKVALLITEGFEELLLIGDQQRPDLFALEIAPRPQLHDEVLGVRERISSTGDIVKRLDNSELDRLLERLQQINPEAIAICLINAYKNPSHENDLKEFLSDHFACISISHQLSPNIHVLPRTETTIANAYLEPVIRTYLTGIDKTLGTARFKIMESAGGLIQFDRFTPKDSLLSGPAGGVKGAAHIAKNHGYQSFISFDMGGTSTDTSRYEGMPDYEYRTRVGSVNIMSPSISIQTVAAGGGSICQFQNGRLTVGPESAGAHPGPACYGQGGPFTLTDAHLLLGNLSTSFFSIPMDATAAESRFQQLRDKINQARSMTDDEILDGFTRVASQKMAQAIREISIKKGIDPTAYVLIPFGGAGGLHACDIAEMLGIGEILFPSQAGVLSALGIGTSPLQRIAGRQVLRPLREVRRKLDGLIQSLQDQAVQTLNMQEGIEHAKVAQSLLYLRLKSQHHVVEITYEKGIELEVVFRNSYREVFGYLPEDIEVEVESIKVIAQAVQGETADALNLPQWSSTKFQDEGFHTWDEISVGGRKEGPIVIANAFSTLLVKSNWEVERISDSVIRAREISSGRRSNEAIQYEMFFNRFESLAVEMGAQLQRTAYSVNVKERLDFSCALLDYQGSLLINAPHIPVHLGSLGICTRLILRDFPIGPGDTIITNHPKYGGSHLPDITLVSGAFTPDGKLIGYVTNRAHHAEIGGCAPGSMPITAKRLEEEGVIIEPTYLIKRGEARWDELTRIFEKARFPSRSLEANRADIRAALASLASGRQNLRALAGEYPLELIHQYMDEIRRSSREALTTALGPLSGHSYIAEERLDDGSVLRAAVKIDKDGIHFDFSGTGPVHPQNMNANEAIVRSVIIYILRLMCQKDLPLNEGMMELVKLTLPRSLLNPDFDRPREELPATVGGNTEVSQRLVDTLIKALGIMSCGQGTMNNLLFGNDRFGYYETIGGGAGAGPGFHGRSGVHQHMTNTRITDPEELELRYPVRVEQFSLRRGSGGQGKFLGGDGIIRKLRFSDKLEVTLLSQHRVEAPFGMDGGKPGQVGDQYLMRKGQRIDIQGIDSFKVRPGDILTIETPGGGGYGHPADNK